MLFRVCLFVCVCVNLLVVRCLLLAVCCFVFAIYAFWLLLFVPQIVFTLRGSYGKS